MGSLLRSQFYQTLAIFDRISMTIKSTSELVFQDMPGINQYKPVKNTSTNDLFFNKFVSAGKENSRQQKGLW